MVVGYAGVYVFPKFGRRKESKGKKGKPTRLDKMNGEDLSNQVKYDQGPA